MGEIKSNRDIMQEEFADQWLDSDRKGSLILGTGFGKSKVTMLILVGLFERGELTKESKILILTDSEHLRDINWKEDFEKWGYSWIWELIVAECYQTTYKWSDTSWDFVIADEIDFSMTEEYSKFYLNNKLKMILGLTGFVDDSKLTLLDSIAPIVSSYTTQKAQEDGILNSTQIVFVQFDLSRNPTDIKVEYVGKDGKTKSFHQSENEAYAYQDNLCNVLWGKIVKLESDPDVMFEINKEKVQELKSLRYRQSRAVMDRKAILLNGIASVTITRKVIHEVLKNPNNKVLTFSMYTAQSDLINECTFHNKNKKGNTTLEDLNEGRIRSAGVCKAINRGKNLVGVNNMIMESYDGSATAFHQRHGRGMRLKPDQKMYLYILLPYFHKKIQSPENKNQKAEIRMPTQAKTWAESMMKDYEIINPIRIKL